MLRRIYCDDMDLIKSIENPKTLPSKIKSLIDKMIIRVES